MDLFGLWSAGFHWSDVFLRLGPALTALFLLLLAGLAFTRLHRRPRPVWFFLASIGLSLFVTWGLEIGSRFVPLVISMLGGAWNDEWTYFTIYLGQAMLALVLGAAIWWCLILAVFDPGESPPDSDEATEEPAR